MGIRNLMWLIKEYAPDAIRESGLDEFKGKTIAIDASIVIYKWYTVGSRATRRIVNARGQPINHIQGALFLTVALLTRGIIPVYVFDGPAPTSKTAVLEKRRAIKATNGGGVPREAFEEVINLLRIMQVSIIIAPSEAEAQAAHMNATGIVDTVATDDTDALVFGAKCVLRGLGSSSDVVINVDRDAVLRGLGVNETQFIDLCILLGSDYTGTMPKIGRQRALNLVKKYGSIEQIIVGEGLTCPPTFNFILARNEFTGPQVNRDINIMHALDRQAGPRVSIDTHALRTLLVDIHGLEPKRINKTLAKLSMLD